MKPKECERGFSGSKPDKKNGRGKETIWTKFHRCMTALDIWSGGESINL